MMAQLDASYVQLPLLFGLLFLLVLLQDNELGKRIFATALFCGFDGIQLRTAIQDFRVYKQNHPDFKLPVTSSDAFFTSSGRKSDKVWTKHKKNSFFNRQWSFLAPVLFPNMKNPILKLEHRHIFPWIKEDPKPIGAGSFGEVRQVTLSKSNIVEPAFQGSPIAVKALKNVDKGDDEENDVQNSRNEWDREVRTHINIKNMKDGKAGIFCFNGPMGGNLRDFWKSHPNPTPTAALVEKFLHQLRGIADALYNLHTFKRDGCEDGSYRHGDLKPENILSVGSLKGDFGTLMVSDLGLAKHHPLATNLRRHQTSTEATTWRYQPPEVSIEEKKSIGRSRRYDIWSMGCVTLEFIIWLLYGNDILNQFNDSINKPTSRPCLPDFNRSPWFTTDDDTNTARLHDSVKKTISIILKKDPECQGPEKTALHSLIELVRDRLLVVDLGSEAELAGTQTFAYMKSDASASTPEIRVEQVDANERNVSPPVSHSSTGRATSEEFLLAVNKILADGSRNPSYWFTGKPREHIRAEIESFDTPDSNRLQIGFPNLTVSDSQQFGLMRQWLNHCDSNPNHKCKPPPNSPLPTRVIDLGSKAEPSLRLYETQPGDSFKFVALSHRWGDEGQGHFRTTKSNYSAHTQAIPFEQLPMNFQDAIRVTRELDIRYLWIDSICIIQGIGGDFTEEAKRMESVFSSAYCVVAASSAHNQHEGFLKTRKKWDYVTLTSKKPGSNKEVGAGEIYIGPFRDDFKEHAINSPLSERGWCGNGIRCESLAKIDNKLLAFLGDPNFPSKLSGKQSDRGEKIRFYEGLYSQYSRLTLTRPADRPIAIAGLEERLIRDLDGCSGGFGVFDDKQSLLPRSLLWQRDRRFLTLEKIDKINVHTWSWMAYQGGIDYMDVPLGGVDWDPNVTEIKGNWNGTTGHTEQMELNAKTRDFEMGRLGALQPPSFRKLKCVLLGRIKGHGDPKDLTHYVLVVALGKPKPTSRPSLMPSLLKPGDQPQMETYERVGVGKMAGRFIDFTEDKSQPRIWVTIL
ncbi:hypothetical protein QBC32DRAFT_400483 [Pseudoneurospora amorphoporcata]|uniref:Protein kinase domain-containing protein n=1 Tax=Pseudoneurospora amorphoporcata TaxID=241081 RepID=A0AAN6NNE0_9PEZI|nr:hypothetical protein QBC32DRAFT_400483 [Pseudoneurospora amorphoporcata]